MSFFAMGLTSSFELTFEGFLVSLQEKRMVRAKNEATNLRSIF
jgi:hypothetical protein